MNIYAITDGSGSTLSKYDIDARLQDMGIPEDVIAEGESAISDYADANSIDLTQIASDVAKENPIAGSAFSAKEDNENELKLLGVPEDIIQQGHAAVQEYAFQNNIKLPYQVGSQMNFMS